MLIELREKKEDLKESIIEVTKKFLIEDKRRYFGIAGAGLKNQLNDPKYKEYNINKKLVEKGIEGEKETSKILRNWMKDKKDVVLLDSISLPLNNLSPEEDDEGQLDLGDTDHLLIIGSNLVIIDSKNWKSNASYKIDENGEILRSGKSFKGNRPRAREMRYLWEKFFEDYNIENFYTFVTISSPKPFIERNQKWWSSGYHLTNQETIIKFLNDFYEEMEEKGFIRVELVAKALTGLIRPYDRLREKFKDIDKIIKK